jgi:hypothetical protein
MLDSCLLVKWPSTGEQMRRTTRKSLAVTETSKASLIMRRLIQIRTARDWSSSIREMSSCVKMMAGQSGVHTVATGSQTGLIIAVRSIAASSVWTIIAPGSVAWSERTVSWNNFSCAFPKPALIYCSLQVLYPVYHVHSLLLRSGARCCWL